MDLSKAPKPPKIPAWRNVIYAWGKLRQQEGPAYFFLLPLSIVCEVAAPLLAVGLPSVVVRMYQTGSPWQTIAWTILALASALTFLNLGKSFCQDRLTSIPFFFRLDMGHKFLARCVTRSYQQAESPAGQASMMMAKQSIYAGDEIGIEALVLAAGNSLCQMAGFVVYFLISAQLNPWILLVILATTFGIALLNGRKNRLQNAHFEVEAKSNENIIRVANRIMDSKYAKDIHLYNMKAWLLGTLDSLIGLHLSRSSAYCRKLFTLQLGKQLLILLRDGLVYGYLISRMVTGSLSVADFILFAGVASGISAWLSGLAEQCSNLKSNSDILSHYRLFMEELPQAKKQAAPPKVQVPNPGRAHELRLEHVYFQYPESQDYALEDVSLTLHPGEKLALVGANGAGKSTLVKLLCGLYHPTKGKILLDGVDVSTLSPEDYFQEFSVVFQEVFAFAFPLSSNVACTPNDQIDEARLRESLRLAGLAEKVESLPKGAETSLLRTLDKEGVELSGGQMQRLMLARALYKNASMLLLDEPTAALDPLAELDMYQHYNQFAQGKTCVFISHRLSSTRFCDRVIFLENGHITESGTHDALMAQAGSYAHMFQIQSHYYQLKEGEENG